MQFTVTQVSDKDGFNATQEIAEAANYPMVRSITVGTTTTSTVPLQQLAVPAIAPWASVADPKVIGMGAWSATSAACWFYGRNLVDTLKIPVGLIGERRRRERGARTLLRARRARERASLTVLTAPRAAGSNWGGTIIQSWANNATNAACGITEGAENSTLPASADNVSLRFAAPGFEERVRAGPDPNHGFGVLYNAMIAPFVLGPMSLSSMIWFQVSKRRRRARALAPPRVRTCRRRRHCARTHSR